MPFQIKTGMFHDEVLELRRVDKKLITILEIGVAFFPITTVLQFMQASRAIYNPAGKGKFKNNAKIYSAVNLLLKNCHIRIVELQNMTRLFTFI